MKAHIGDHTDKSTPVKATYESTRRRAQRRKADAKTGKHTLRESVHVETRMDMSQIHFVSRFTGKTPFTLSGTRILYRNLHEKTHMDISEEQFM